jgi:hypothetical protein
MKLVDDEPKLALVPLCPSMVTIKVVVPCLKSSEFSQELLS